MVNEYIEKIVVYEAIGGRKSKDKKQQVGMPFNLISNIEHNGKLKLITMRLHIIATWQNLTNQTRGA